MSTHLTTHSRVIQEHARQLGLATMLMLQCKEYSEYQILCLKVWTEQAILHRQIKFFFNDLGAPVGYVTWAYLSEEIENKIAREGLCLLHPSEWDEGDRLWILDFCSPGGHTWDIVRHIKHKMFHGVHEAKWIRARKAAPDSPLKPFITKICIKPAKRGFAPLKSISSESHMRAPHN